MLQTGYDWFDERVQDCGDVNVQRIGVSERSVIIAHTEQMVNDDLLVEAFLPRLYEALEGDGGFDPKYPLENLPHGTSEEQTDVLTKLFSGYVLLFGQDEIRACNLSKLPGRQPEESNSEVSVKGPRDGFVEEMSVNLALIRKRLRTPDLKIERYSIGDKNRFDMTLLYLKGKAKPESVEEARKRMTGIHTTAINGASQVEEMLADHSASLFPLIDYAGRPDSAAEALLTGSVIFMLEGSPMVFLAPINLLALLRTPEDNYMPYYFVTMEKLIRICSLFIAIFLPGFWVALSAFNIDQIPFPLLSTIIISRIGLPTSVTMEMVMMLAMFEVFREAGVRLPRAVGQTVAVVGGIIVGDAAIRAGMTSPTMLVVSSLTAVASFTLVNQSLSGAVTVVRLFVLLLSMTFGMFGFFISGMVVLMYLTSLRSLGAPYMLPLAPVKWRQIPRTFLRLPASWTKEPYGPKPQRARGRR